MRAMIDGTTRRSVVLGLAGVAALQLDRARAAGEPGRLSINVMGVRIATTPKPNESERDNVFEYNKKTFDPHKSALVLVDCWRDHPTEGFAARMSENVLAYTGPALDAARSAGMTIIHAPTNLPIHPRLLPRAGETIVHTANTGHFEADLSNDTQQVVDVLDRGKIGTAFYVGYATNICMFGKGAAFYRVYTRRPGLQYFLLSDCTIGYELAETIDGELMRRAFTDYAIMFGANGGPGGAISNPDFFRALA
jgi:hypothetical protein